MAAITRSSRQQSAGIADVDRALEQIERSAGITSAHAEQSAQSSAHLNSEAIRLNRLADELSASRCTASVSIRDRLEVAQTSRAGGSRSHDTMIGIPLLGIMESEGFPS